MDMTVLQLDFGPLKEPIGFIKLLEWIFAIFGFATCGRFSGETAVSMRCKASNNTVTYSAAFHYPFRLNTVILVQQNTCNQTMNTYLTGDMSSSAEFFVTVAVFAFLYCLAALVLYVGYLHVYRDGNRGPIIDFVVTVIFAFLWLVCSSAWGKGLSDVKYSTDPEVLKNIVDACQLGFATCSAGSVSGMGSLNVSVVFGFLNLILWCGNAWFVYKETSWHTTPEPSVPNPGNVPPQNP
ncbi:synaptophysin-like protein 1 isoform X3 [Callorhinchus milii]|uniref:synaptophysin-like protein 1 isoform X2 n=1 Tax=Callorhinchus milii TaxID=7868 RepID=UPI001C3FA32F|nr:synaptophysin-like protein 1 isoform X2 [Callorhinchus milii]XP_042190950.1 synaptophysin-like protein 1 isoform X3 [Callorhinchus milii]